MQRQLSFPIQPTSALCREVLAHGIDTFDQLAEYVRSLPYRRTTNTADPLAVLQEKRGTCSAKHRLLAVVAHDCGHSEVQLTVGVYEMSDNNTPGVGAVLRAALLTSIPEAHCYLTVEGERFDFTGLPSGSSSPFTALLAEHFVPPADLSQAKVSLHKHVVATWADARGISRESAWATREACIAALTALYATSRNVHAVVRETRR